MKKLIYIALSLFFITACTSTETQLKEAIQNYYQKVSLQSGAGSHDISEIEILSFENDTAIVAVSGYYSNNSLPQPESGNIQNKLGFIMEKTNSGFKVKKVFEVR